jgi:hypothetical protein
VGLLPIRPVAKAPLDGVGPRIEFLGPKPQLLSGRLGPRSGDQIAALLGKAPEEIRIHYATPKDPVAREGFKVRWLRLAGSPAIGRAAGYAAHDIVIMEDKPRELHHYLSRPCRAGVG